jgi:hypothetical protein
MTLRDYGLGESTQYVTGPPTIRGWKSTTFCPNCAGETVFTVQVPVVHPDLASEGGKGIGTYEGCAACPWAGPMVMTARGGDDDA